MKKAICVFLLLFALLLSGCGQKDLHPEWEDTGWTRFGDLLAAETPENFYLGEYNDALSVNGIWNAVWNCGQEPEMITNDRGEEAAVYDAQIYLVLKECSSEDEAQADMADWIGREAQSYETGESREIEAAGQRWSCRVLLSAGAENPYSRGASAFAVRGKTALCAELLCGEGFEGDPEAILEQFLIGFHYGE